MILNRFAAAGQLAWGLLTSGRMPTPELMNDASLRDEIAQAIRLEPEVQSADINVAVQDGVATLTGFVHSYFAKLAAEEAAKRAPGIQGLANDIQVKPGTEATDPEIARSAVMALRGQSCVPEHAIRVTVRDGLLTLEGTVESYQQKRAAEDAVMTVHGAKGVISRIEIRPRRHN